MNQQAAVDTSFVPKELNPSLYPKTYGVTPAHKFFYAIVVIVAICLPIWVSFVCAYAYHMGGGSLILGLACLLFTSIAGLGCIDEAYMKTTLYVDHIESIDILGNKNVLHRNDICGRRMVMTSAKSSAPALIRKGEEDTFSAANPFILPSHIRVDEAWKEWMDVTAPKLVVGKLANFGLPY